MATAMNQSNGRQLENEPALSGHQYHFYFRVVREDSAFEHHPVKEAEAVV